jgi:hypothetical protein
MLIVIQWNLSATFGSLLHVFFQAMKNAIVLHQYMLFCNFDLLMNQKVGNWVKAHNVIEYLHFLMMQYDNHKWVGKKTQVLMCYTYWDSGDIFIYKLFHGMKYL